MRLQMFRRAAILGTGLTLVATFAAGCGGSGAPPVADLGATSASYATTSVSAPSAAAGSSGAETGGSGGGGKVGAAFSVLGSLQQMTKFAACMRANGEPGFPDPNAKGVIAAPLNRASPQVDQALQACRKDMPGGRPSPAQQVRDLRKAVAFAACMRREGVPDYPDPSDGGSVIRLTNVDPSSPLVEKAQQICQKKVPGSGKG